MIDLCAPSLFRHGQNLDAIVWKLVVRFKNSNKGIFFKIPIPSSVMITRGAKLIFLPVLLLERRIPSKPS